MSRPTQRLPAVVFLHGIGGCARLWAPQLSAFAAAGFQPLALDLPGYGSRAPVKAMAFDALAADVEAAIDRDGLERPVLVGHSFGGMVAQASLRRRPDAYRAMILCATSPAFGNRQGDFQKRFVASRLEALDDGGTLAQLAPGLVEGLVGPAADPAARPQAIAAMSAVDPDTYRAAVSCLVNFDERANLAAISIPVLCLAGQFDRTAPAEMMQRMADKIAGAVYHCLPGVGHLANLEAPAAFNAACLDFLRRTCQAAPV